MTPVEDGASGRRPTDDPALALHAGAVAPSAETLAIAAEYDVAGLVIAAEDAAAGGDWYDAFAVGDHVALVVGDVAGHGPAAARDARWLRSAFRASFLDRTEPASVLAHVDELVRAVSPSLMCTCIVGVLDPGAGRLEWCRAGHPFPVHLDGGAPRLLDGAGGPPVGAGDLTGITTHELVLEPGDTLVLYTDGLVERPDEALDTGLGRLLAATSTHDLSATNRCIALAQACAPAAPADDICLLVVRRPAR